MKKNNYQFFGVKDEYRATLEENLETLRNNMFSFKRVLKIWCNLWWLNSAAVIVIVIIFLPLKTFILLINIIAWFIGNTIGVLVSSLYIHPVKYRKWYNKLKKIKVGKEELRITKTSACRILNDSTTIYYTNDFLEEIKEID